MANFSQNQVLHLYAANAYKSSVAATDAAGTIGDVKVIDDGMGKQLYFKYKGVDTVSCSDFIPLNTLTYAKSFSAKEQLTPLRKLKVALNASVNSGNLEAGEDYILGIVFRGFFSSGEDSQYYKDVAVHAVKGMTATQFYTALKNELNAAFSREADATGTSNPYVEFTSDSNGLYVTEKPQEWKLGTKKARRIMFDIQFSTIYTGGDDLIWGTVTDQTPARMVLNDGDWVPNPALVAGTNAFGNGQHIADLEWFCMGNRGDQYRMAGWPNVIETKYLVDPTKQYNVLELHYAFTDTGVNSYRTEKEITVVADDATVLNSFIGAINSAASLSIPTIPV